MHRFLADARNDRLRNPGTLSSGTLSSAPRLVYNASMTTNYVIETQGLRKEFGERTAVADLSLQVPRGETFGFLGPNGAGKSTSIKMLLGLVKPTGGKARVLNHAPGQPAAMARIGFLPEHFRFHPWLQAEEFLDLHGRLYSMSAEARHKRIAEVLELVGLSEHRQRPIAGFSKGMLQRIGLAQALLNDPELVFLDEPTSALDPFGRILVRNIMAQLKREGKTIFLNSHLLGEVEATCDRVSFIRQGTVLQTMALRELSIGSLQVELQLDTASPALLQALEQIPGVVKLQPQTDTPSAAHLQHDTAIIHLTLEQEEQLPEIAACVHAQGARLYALSPRRISLEQLFLNVVGSQDSGQ